MKTALCLGGAASLFEDIELCPVAFDGVVACNEAGVEWEGELDAWVSLHRDKMGPWRARRERRGHPVAKCHVVTPGEHERRFDLVTESRFPGMSRDGSSGMFTAKVALCDLGFDRVVLCGVPLTRTPHFFPTQPWSAALGYRKTWSSIPEEYRARMRSMSGWTRVLLGSPADWVAAT